MSRAIVRAAPAKINLALEVLGRRADGFHDLVSIFATIDLADRVRVAAARSLDVRIRPDVGAPAGEDLATRAVQALAAAIGHPPFAHIRIRKRIPVAAGLGGGSSDAAAVLGALRRIWRVDIADLGADLAADLGSIAASIGSDVPFFTAGTPFASVTGRGESVRSLPAPPRALWSVLVRVRARLATPAVFAALRREEWTDGAATAELAAAFADGTIGPELLRRSVPNGLLAAAERVCPAIADARAAAAAKGVALSLSGSGPTLFWIADGRADALRCARTLRRAGLDAQALVLGVPVAL